jgi:CHAT domain-containing protein
MHCYRSQWRAPKSVWPISDEVTVQIMSAVYQAAHNTGKAPEALAEVQRNWLLKLRTEKGLAQAVILPGHSL